MPVLASPSTWRANPHQVKGYLYAHTPDVVFSALVNQASFSYPLASLTFDTVTVGAYTDIVIGMTARISSPGGAVKGYAPVRLTPTSSIIYLGVIGQNDIDVANNDVIEVLDEFRLWAKIPRIDATNPRNVVFYKDYNLAYSDQGSKPNPVCVAGPHRAKFVDDSDIITVDFDLTDSFAVAPSATISSYSGDIQDGTVISGSIASGVFTATFPAGKRWCYFTVTDSNAKTHTARRLIVACERTGANAPMRVEVSSQRGSLEGWEASFKILQDDASVTALPDNTIVLYFEEETYGGTSGSLNGYPDAEQVKFVGWAVSDSLTIDPETSDIEFSAQGPLGILRTLPGFSQSVTNKTSPTAWDHMKSLTLFRFIWYMMHWHTTLLDVCDLELPGWSSVYPYSRFDADQSDPFTLLNQMAESVTAKLTCDRAGRLYLRQNPLYMSDADRDDVPTTLTLEASDWSSLSLDERHRAPDYWLRASGLLASSSVITAYLCIAPGTSPGQGQQEDTFDRQLVTSQSDLNARAGHVYAERNSRQPRYTFSVFRGGQVVDPAWREWINVTFSAATNRRGVEQTDGRVILTELSVSQDHETGTHTEEWVAQPETTGVPGVTYYLPESRMEDITFTPLPPFEFTLPDLIEFDARPDGTGFSFTGSPAMYVQDIASKKMLRCRNFGSGSETYELMWDLSDIPSAYTLTDYAANFVLDGWNPKQAMYIATIAADIVGNIDVLEIWYVENLNAAPGAQTFTRLYTSTESFALSGAQGIMASINVNGMFGVAYIEADLPSRFKFALRLSRSGSFTKHAWGNAGGSQAWAFGNHAASSASGRLYVAKRDSDFTIRIYPSSDNGATLGSSEHSFGAGNNPNFIHIPYENNAADDVAYMGGDPGLVRRAAGGAWSAVDIPSGKTPYRLHSYTGDRNYLLCLGYIGDPSDSRLYRSIDAGDNWTEIYRPGSDDTHLNQIGGWPYSQEIMVADVTFGVNRGIYWTDDLFSAAAMSVTWNNALGDLETVTGMTFAGAHCVPVWVA